MGAVAGVRSGACRTPGAALRTAPPTGAPHEAQNRALGVSASPHEGHPPGATGVPHVGQKRAPCGAVAPQAAHTDSPPVMLRG
jgi:hypothetical protein